MLLLLSTWCWPNGNVCTLKKLLLAYRDNNVLSISRAADCDIDDLFVRFVKQVDR